MTIDMKDLLPSILESLERIEYIKPEDIPNIDLYMDQVTTFMDSKLKSSTRNPGDDKVLTKTMINNYTKNNLLPPPVKKKYSKEHVLLLIFIYYFKNILSINDIQTLLQPLTEKFFEDTKDFSLEQIYNEVFSMEYEYVQVLKEDVVERFNHAQATFEYASKDSENFLRQFSFICMLSFDVYVKKMLIEKMIDGMRPNAEEKNQAASSEKKSKKEEKAKKEEKTKGTL